MDDRPVGSDTLGFAAYLLAGLLLEIAYQIVASAWTPPLPPPAYVPKVVDLPSAVTIPETVTVEGPIANTVAPGVTTMTRICPQPKPGAEIQSWSEQRDDGPWKTCHGKGGLDQWCDP